MSPEEKENELNARELMATKEAGTRKSANDKLLPTSNKRKPPDDTELQIRRAEVINMVALKESYTFTSLNDFATKMQIPLKNLEMMLKDHHERDHLVKQSIHEHNAFIKVHEGYPHPFDQLSSQANTFKFTE